MNTPAASPAVATTTREAANRHDVPRFEIDPKWPKPLPAGWITGQRAAYEYLCSSIELFPSGGDMESLMTSCGFSRVTTHRLSLGIASLYEAEK